MGAPALVLGDPPVSTRTRKCIFGGSDLRKGDVIKSDAAWACVTFAHDVNKSRVTYAMGHSMRLCSSECVADPRVSF